MSDASGFRPELKTRLVRAFERASRHDLNLSPRMEMQRAVFSAQEKRIAQVREKMRAHIHKHRERWTHQEERRLQRARPEKFGLSRAGGPRPPAGASDSTHARKQALKRVAQANVNRRCAQKVGRIEKIEAKMLRTATRTQTRSRSR